MYEAQGESDEDCEVYFLKPVNEYNIVDKIKEANKELFTAIADDDVDGEEKIIENLELTESTTSIRTTISTQGTSTTTITRKVTFAPNLEVYEPDTNSLRNEEKIATDENDLRHKIKSGIEKFPTIDEQEELIQIATIQRLENVTENLENSVEKILDETNETKEEINESDEKTTTTSKNYVQQNDEIDEICEEIIIMEMNGSITTTTTTMTATTPKTTTVSTTLLKEDSLNAQQRRLMHKQTTFDYDEQDNKSLTNLLTASDCEDEHAYSAMRDTDDSDDNDGSFFVGIDDFDIDDDEDDDKLSLIVASYLPDDFERKIAMPPSSSSSLTKVNASSSAHIKNSNTSSKPSSYSYFRRGSGDKCSSAKKSNSPSSSTALGRRFQLRRKAHSTNSIGAMCGDGIGSAINSSKDSSKSELTDLKLNYKTCCEYRNAIQGKLPKYTGYLSEYGLSREQLQQRDQQMQKKQRFVLEQTLRANEDEIRKMQDNERAFTTWLKNKMRYPINKTRNMFDVKLNLNGRRKKTKATTNVATNDSALKNNNNNNKSNQSPFGCAAT